MSFSFKYRPIKLKSGETIYRPMIPLILDGKEKMDIMAILDSGSDMTIIPKEIAEVIGVEYERENEVSGITGVSVKAKEGVINVIFGKGRENYSFSIPVLVPEKANINIIIGRLGFFEQFKITFFEAERKIEFRKVNQDVLLARSYQ